MKKFFPACMRPYRHYLAAGIFCIMAESFLELLIPMIMADIIDVGVANADRAYIFAKGAQMILCALLSLALGIGSSRFAAAAGQGFGAEIRKAEFQKIQQFSFANTDHFSTSSLVTRLTSDVTTIQNTISTGLRPAFRSPVMLITALVVSFSLNARLALVFLVAAPVLAVLLFLIICRVRPLYTRMQGAIDLVNRIIQENLTAIRVVKSYVREDHEIEKFRGVNTGLMTTAERAFRLGSMNMPAMQFVMYTTILCILWFGGNLVYIGDMQVGKLTWFLSYVLQVLNSLMMMSNVFLLMTRALASGRRIMDVMEEDISIKDTGDKNRTVTKGHIRFDHVSFKYKDTAAEKVLTDISFHILPGQTVGIIGQTGSAKSTLVQLIPRLYEASEGTVYLDGRPVSDYSLTHLRDAIAMVLQKNTLFSGTVLDNLRWGKEDASMEEVEQVCHIACVDEFIDRLPDGYNTELGQGGVNVSGGQKQRLCIARALLKSPKVLILDDSTSAVDTATEGKIRERLAGFLPGTTKIIIAQRISSVLGADQILILDDGKLHAAGTHEELLKSSSIYREIYESQMEGRDL